MNLYHATVSEFFPTLAEAPRRKGKEKTVKTKCTQYIKMISHETLINRLMIYLQQIVNIKIKNSLIVCRLDRIIYSFNTKSASFFVVLRLGERLKE